MSFVGPRPCIPYEYENFTSLQRRRFQSAPGLTGLWQVSGKNRTTFDRMIQLDIEYSARKSLGLDLKIIALTLPAILIQIADMCRARHKKTAAAPADGATASPATGIDGAQEAAALPLRSS
jgi:lipopolysaccharide/colanic/teichoic acid biosynthesis glycosyltransferase